MPASRRNGRPTCPNGVSPRGCSRPSVTAAAARCTTAREHLRFEDHLLNISRKDISADVPMVLNVETVAPPDGVGHHFRDEPAERPQVYLPRPQQPDEGPGKVLIFDDNGPLVLPQGSPQLRTARYAYGCGRRGLRRLSVNVVGLQQRSRPSFDRPIVVDRLRGCRGAPPGRPGRCNIVRGLATDLEWRFHRDDPGSYCLLLIGGLGDVWFVVG
jgi:hypothetical protein